MGFMLRKTGVPVLLALLGLGILVGAYVVVQSRGKFQGKVWSQASVGREASNRAAASGTTNAERLGKSLSNGKCVGNEKRQLTTLPMKLEDFSMIIPYGLVVGDHVTPIDHQYFSPTVFRSPRDTYEVRAMADSVLVDIQPRRKPDYTEYRLVFSISCRLFYYYDLVTSLSSDIRAVVAKTPAEGQRYAVNIPVKAGQVIGKIGGQTLDFAVWDTDVTLPGFVVPEQYQEERWKAHTVDPLNYYTDDLKKQALSKYIRTVPPVSGKIDYDIDGKLVGNWFLEGTNGYQGLKRQSLEGYSKTHLAIVPNHLDPSVTMISFGDFGGRFGQFAAAKGATNPTTVSVETGPVKYELFDVSYTKQNGEPWNRVTFATNITASVGGPALGCVLFQLQDRRTLKTEAFPSADCRSVSGFSAKAALYER